VIKLCDFNMFRTVHAAKQPNSIIQHPTCQVSEWVSSFLMAHQHIRGYSVCRDFCYGQGTWTNLQHFCHTSTPFVYNTSANCNVHIKFIMQSGASPCHLAKVTNPDFTQWLAGDFQHKLLSRTSLGRLLNEINSSGISKDRKTEAVPP